MRSPHRLRVPPPGMGGSGGNDTLLRKAVKKRRDALLKDRGFEKENEKTRQKQLRLRQVREQANEAAKLVRSRVKEEQERQILVMGKSELAKYIAAKKDELSNLEAEYQAALKEVGQGHQGVKEHEEYLKWKELRRQKDAELARIRGDRAMTLERNRATLVQAAEASRRRMRRCIKDVEDLRAAAEVKKMFGPLAGKAQLVTVDAIEKRRRVNYVKRSKLVVSHDPVEDGQKEFGPEEWNREHYYVLGHADASTVVGTAGWVRRLPLKDVNGVEAAIQEQMEQVQKEQEQLYLKALQEQAVKRALHVKDQSQGGGFLSSFKLYDDDEDGRRRDYDLRRREEYFPYDHVPVRDSAILIRSRQRRPQVEDNITPQHTSEQAHPQRGPDLRRDVGKPPAEPKMVKEGRPFDSDGNNRLLPRRGGSPSAFKAPVKKLETIEEWPDSLLEPSASGEILKDDSKDHHRSFIAKVLKDLHLPLDEAVKIKINIQEISARSSEMGLDVVDEGDGPSSHGHFLHSSSGSSSDITREKFLSETWKVAERLAVGPSKLAGATNIVATDESGIQGLIGQLTSSEPATTTVGQESDEGRQQLLRDYIEKLLQLKRAEIDDLSISQISSMSSTTFSSSGQHRSDASSCSGPISTPSTSSKAGTITSRTPTSILSSSESRSSSSSMNNRTVRFADNDETTNESAEAGSGKAVAGKGRRVAGADNEEDLDRRSTEIMQHTRASLAKVQKAYDDQRRLIEAELARRRRSQQSLERGVSSLQLSEGALSTSGSCRDSSLNRSSPAATSSSSSPNNAIRSTTRMKKPRQGGKRAAPPPTSKGLSPRSRLQGSRVLNKSSSSAGAATTTTTSSSNATAEFLSMLRRVEMPRLAPPPPEFWQKIRTQQGRRHRSNDLEGAEVDTSVDLQDVGGSENASGPADKQSRLRDIGGNISKEAAEDQKVVGGRRHEQRSSSFSSFQFSTPSDPGGQYRQSREDFSDISLSSSSVSSIGSRRADSRKQK